VGSEGGGTQGTQTGPWNKGHSRDAMKGGHRACRNTQHSYAFLTICGPLTAPTPCGQHKALQTGEAREDDAHCCCLAVLNGDTCGRARVHLVSTTFAL